MRFRIVLIISFLLGASLTWADTCAELKAAYTGDVNNFVTLVTNRIQTFGSVPPNGLAWTGPPPVHPLGSGTGVTLEAQNWDARNVDQCGNPVGLSWRDLNIQPSPPSPVAFKLDQYVAASDQLVGYTLTVTLVCNGVQKFKTINVAGSEVWREQDDW